MPAIGLLISPLPAPPSNLLANRSHGTAFGMKRAHLVIVDARRLLILLPEVWAAVEIAAQVCARFPRSRCHWVVLDDECLPLLRHLLDDGEPEVALWVLQQNSLEAGPMDFNQLAERKAA